MKFILGLKLGMSRIFNEEGKVIPITLIDAGPCVVIQVKEKEKDGYEAIQLGFIPKEKRIKKTEKGKEFRFIKEQRILIRPQSYGGQAENKEQFKIGNKIDASIFNEGDKVKISGISKGKGFAGVVKRWGFRGRSSSHGTKHELRTGGSVGTSHPQRVSKGRKMPGRAGGRRVTVKNLKIIKIDPKNNIIAVRGAIPGRRGTLVEIKGI